MKRHLILAFPTAIGLWGCADAESSAGHASISTHEEHIFGGVNFDGDRVLARLDESGPEGLEGPSWRDLGVHETDCTLNQRRWIEHAARSASIAVASGDFAECVWSRISGDDRPYAPCPTDPLADSSDDSERLRTVLEDLRSPVATGITCIDPAGHELELDIGAAARPESGGVEQVWIVLENTPEELEGLIDPERSQSVKKFDLALASGVLAHEILHNREWTHADTLFEPDRCPQQNTLANSMPYIVWECAIDAVTNELCDHLSCRGSREHAELTRDGKRHVAENRPGDPECECVRPPASTIADVDVAHNVTLGENQEGQRFGHATAVGDFDDDGFQDLAVGMPDRLNQDGSRGAVALYKGTFYGLYPWRLLEGSPFFDGFGSSLLALQANAISGVDLLVGAPGTLGVGSITLYLGTDDGPEMAATLLGQQADAEFGHSLALLEIDAASAGGIYAAVGAPLSDVDTGSEVEADAGEVALVLMNSSALSLGQCEMALGEGNCADTAMWQVALLDGEYSGGDQEPVGPTAGARFGSSVATGEFVLSSGTVRDLVVGAPGSGRAFSFEGTDLLPTPPLAVGSWAPTRYFDGAPGFGAAVALVDVDGACDPGGGNASSNHNLLVGSPDEDRIQIFDDDGSQCGELSGPSGSGFGATMTASLVEFNEHSSHASELFVGAPGSSQVFLYGPSPEPPGGGNGLQLEHTLSPADGFSPDGEFGGAIAEGDFNADGLVDLVVSAPSASWVGPPIPAPGPVGGLFTYPGVLSADDDNPTSIDPFAFAQWRFLDFGEDFATFTFQPRPADFEDPRDWSPFDLLSPNTELFTEGNASISVNASGYTRLNSTVFASNAWAEVGSALVLDSFVFAAGQPNPHYLGAVQLYVSIPSANLFEVYLGQVELTPLGGGWHSLAFPLSPELQQTLLDVHPDVTVGVAVNTLPGSPAVLLDNLRFDGTLVPHPGPGDPPPSGSCSEASAVDLGAPGHDVTVANDGCVMVRDAYPSWWGAERTMQLQNTGSGTYPIPFEWSSPCGTPGSGSGQITGDWQTQALAGTNSACATLIDLQGSGNGNVTLSYY